ncbi:MAG TPA: hypothetical protein VFC33_19340 [Acidimicrobiia bacterium]|nr:hypothetical protein [Acidimicrobiia bacterium]
MSPSDAETSWGYLRDDVMADPESRAAVVEQRRLYLTAQVKKRGLQPVQTVVVTRLASGDAPPGCARYSFVLEARDPIG